MKMQNPHAMYEYYLKVATGKPKYRMLLDPDTQGCLCCVTQIGSPTADTTLKSIESS